MALPLRIATANQVVILGPFLNSTDGVTAVTAALNNNDIKVYKHNSNTGANKNSGGATHIAGGFFYSTLDATDTDTVGRMVVSSSMAGTLPVWHEFHVHNSVWFDSAYGIDYLQTDMIQISSANVSNTAAQLGVNVIQIANNAPASALIGNVTSVNSLNGFASNAITATAFNQAAADKVWATTVREVSSANNIFTANAITAASFNQGAADKVWSTAARTLTASTNIFSANAIDAASFNQGAADKVWASAARTVTSAANITSNNNKLILHTDDKVLLGGTTHTGAIIPVVTSTNNVTGTVASVTAFADNSVTAAAFNQAAADKVWSTAARTVTASTNIFSANAIDAASFNQGAADKVWASAARTVTSAANITSNNNKLILHTDDKVLLAGTTHTSAVIPTVTNTGNVTVGVASVTLLAANAIVASSFNQAAADKVWSTTARTLTGAANITGSGNALVLHTDNKVLLAETTHANAIVPVVTTVNGFGANAITAASMNDDAGAEVATAVWAKTDAALSQTYAVLMERMYRFFMNKMNITDATGVVSLKDDAGSGQIATQTITDDDTDTLRTAMTWS
jgi:hypothetical protein